MTRTNAIIRSIAKRNQRLVGSEDIFRWPSAHGLAWKLRGSEKLQLTDPTGSLVATDDRLMSATFVISTSKQDRDGDIMVSKGCVLDNYKRNPIVFYNHQQWEVPIGKAIGPDGKLAVSVQPDRIIATCYFDQQDSDAAYIYGKVKRGFLSATSIGFIPLEGEQIATKAKPGSVFQRNGWLFKRWELLEFSIVGVPANPEALMLDDLDTAQISVKLRKALQPFAPTRKAATGLGEGISSEGGVLTEEEQRAKADAVEECVSRKIPKLIDEGYPRDQAVAIAYSMCREEHKTEEGPVADKKQYDDEADDTEDADSEAKQMPLGAQCLMELAAHIQAKLPQLEPGITVRKLYEKILPMLAAAAAKDYPDLDLGIEATEKEEQPEEEKKSLLAPVVVTVPSGPDWSSVLKRMAALERKLHIATGRID